PRHQARAQPRQAAARASARRGLTLLGLLLHEARGHRVLVAAVEAIDGHLVARAERLADGLADLLHVHVDRSAVIGLQAERGPADRVHRAMDLLPRLLVDRPGYRRGCAGAGGPRRGILLDVA